MELRLELLSVAGVKVRATRSFAVDHPTGVVIGRGPSDVTVPLKDDRVSRHHARLEWRPGAEAAWWVVDLLSRAGSRLNGRVIREPVQVRAGDLLEIGRSRLLIELGSGGPEGLVCQACHGECISPPGLRHGRRWVCEDCLEGQTAALASGHRELEVIGEGAFGRVVLAARDGRLVALKLSQRDPFGDPDEEAETEARFEREARILAELDHPAVVRLYEAGCSQGEYWVALELMEEDLFRVVRRLGPYSAERAGQIGVDLLAGLSYIHTRGVLHRDLKPNNVLTSVDGVVRLGDFGLCTAAGATKLTATKIGMGTLHYTPPEQLDDLHGVDVRADVYGWGATLYYLLLGRSPYWWARDYPSVVRAMLGEPCPSPHEVDPQVPEGLSRVVARALERDPTRRFASADEALEAWLTARGPGSESSRDGDTEESGRAS